MAQAVDRAYTVLLSHLHKPSSNLPFETLESLIIHFLARTPSPTPLCATIISSPLFRPFSHAKLTALTTAFRHAAHAKYKLLKEEPANIFTQSLNARMESWARAVVNGLNGGQGVIRVVGAGGILLGLEDLKGELKTGKVRRNARGRTEDEVVIALAEVMDMYGGLKDDAWEREFHPETEHGEVDVLSLALLFACQFLGHIDTKRLSALPLATLLAHLMSTIERAFMSGRFLASLGASSSVDPDQKVSLALNQNAKEKHALPYDEPGAFQTTSQLSIDLRSISSSTLFASIALLSRTSAHLLPILVDTRPRDGWITLEDILKRFNAMAATVELHWSVSIMAGIDGDAGISPDSQEIATTMWTVLKTLLFAAVMVSQSALTALVYSHRPSPNADSVPTLTAESLALLALDILHHFAFVISTFGGIASGGFTELKKVFYTALDVLSADTSLSEEFVINMSCAGSVGASSKTAPIDRSPYNRSLQAFRLTCIEQLVPVLSPAALEMHVFQLCVPYLFDHTHRDTFESAHSVVLALFAAQARKHTARGGEPTFVEKLVPFYAQCLLENSAEGKLSVSQLCLAYNALVSSASATSDSLTSYCLFALYEALGASSTDAHRQHRLRLTLISCLSALSLAFFAPALDRVQQIVRDAKEEEKVELVEELFKELMEHVGDQEKELAMRWWADNNKLFAGLGNDTNVDTGLPSEKGKGKELQITPRL